MVARFRFLGCCGFLCLLFLFKQVRVGSASPVRFKGACSAKDRTPSLIKPRDRQTFVTRHNTFRRTIKPSAADMMQLTWSAELAAAAQAWANKCTFQHHFVSDCNGNTVGQNIYGTWSTDGPPKLDVIAAMENWQSEKRNYKFSTKSCSGMCGGFTQLVWAKSRQIGCAVVRCPKLKIPTMGVKNNGYIVVCNYYPSGNTVGTNPYSLGQHCRKCPPHSTCANNLCAIQRGFTDDATAQTRKTSVKGPSVVKRRKTSKVQTFSVKSKKAPLWFKGACGRKNLPSSKFKVADRSKVIQLHNKHRRRSRPPASNMMHMRWSQKLADLAQGWANRCSFWHNYIEDCDGNKVGQNIFAKWENVPHYPSLDVSEAVESWYSEIKDYCYNPNKCLGVCGHYTQVVWATSTQVGCGYMKCPKLHLKPSGAKKKADFIVCNYYPAGNMQGEKPFKYGQRCSKCPAKRKCYSGLCGP